MVKPVVGDVIVVLFPFSDLRGGKRRPALIVVEAEFGNLILCQITSKPYTSHTAIELAHKDFSDGSLPIVSYVRPDKLFTADPRIISHHLGAITPKKKGQILRSLRNLFK